MKDLHDYPSPGSSFPGAAEADAAAPPERRTFLKWAINGLGLLFAAVLGVPAVIYLIDPLNRKRAKSDYRSTGVRLSSLEVNKPVQAVLRDVRHDAWTLHPNDVIGRVWLVKRDKNTVEAFTTVCPHLGCSVNFEASVGRFICPCHNGTFDLEGQRVQFKEGNNPAPRDMDKLKVRRDPKDSDMILVEYLNFRQGEAEKTLKS
jgi:Rieske Fe-S protein